MKFRKTTAAVVAASLCFSLAAAGQGTPPASASSEQANEALSLAAFERKDVTALTALANAGSASAQNRLGFMYENGSGVTKDLAAALGWYRKAADQGYAKAQQNLGLAYYNGRGVTNDDATAVSWFRKAADQGNANAQAILGYAYYNGRGVTKDEVTGVSWYRKAADQGLDTAQLGMALAYHTGIGVAKDQRVANSWALKAADQGNALALKILGPILLELDGAPIDAARSIKYITLRHEQGDNFATQILMAYYFKKLPDIDLTTATRVLLKNPNSTSSLAICTIHGQMYVKRKNSLRNAYVMCGIAARNSDGEDHDKILEFIQILKMEILKDMANNPGGILDYEMQLNQCISARRWDCF